MRNTRLKLLLRLSSSESSAKTRLSLFGVLPSSTTAAVRRELLHSLAKLQPTQLHVVFSVAEPALSSWTDDWLSVLEEVGAECTVEFKVPRRHARGDAHHEA